jgi:hypothetical protein
MINTKQRQYFVWSTFLVATAMLVSLLSAKQNDSTMIRGEPLPDYEISLNASNSPTTSSEYTSATQIVRYTSFTYSDAKASTGNHVEIGGSGYFGNEETSQITSITGVTATFVTEGSVTLWASFDRVDWFDYELTSGLRLELALLPYYIEFYSDGYNSVAYSNIVITYSCVPHSTSPDKYSVYWLDDNYDFLEIDYDVESGTMASYDGPVPTKEPYDGYYFAFNGWDPEPDLVTENVEYVATFIEVELGFTPINGTAYELTWISDSSIIGFNIPSTYNDLPVTEIGAEAFMNFVNLTYITLPTSIETIGESAFSGCSSLTNIEIPENVTMIGISSFADCVSLASLSLPTSLQTIEMVAFGGCTSLTNIEIPENVATIGLGAFVACFALTDIDVDINNVTFGSIDGVLFNDDFSELICYPGNHGTTYSVPSGVIAIGPSAFGWATALTSISIPASVTTILDSAFYSCLSLDEVEVPDTVTTIGPGLFAKCTSLENVSLPSGLTTLPDSTFYECASLMTVSLPSGITTIGNSAFSGCTSLTTITLPHGLTEIGSYAFEGCPQLETVILPSGLLTIKSRAFAQCDGLVTVSIPSSVTSIGGYAFIECASLTAINVDAANANYASVDGVLFNKDITTLIIYPNGKTNLECEIPETVTTITENAFRANTYLTAVYIPATVLTIQGYAFYLCTNLNIYCAVSAPLAGWAATWNQSNRPVTWDYVF